MQTLDKISDHISSLEGSDTVSEYSLDFATESETETGKETASVKEIDHGMDEESKGSIAESIPGSDTDED